MTLDPVIQLLAVTHVMASITGLLIGLIGVFMLLIMVLGRGW